ncbi:putative TonB family protein [Magnetospirillum sp. XM-1]|uniref:TonB family protein n=1 Tax=Magnetospirillum sp. XM-1 TaxID=1663591 RepID=UPI00073DE0C3|nr:TonB family protein [Magnetospirillum sp. XM-1]CUW41599.1 putative TonB family protein [Magnetospirillum sp. XM-1]
MATAAWTGGGWERREGWPALLSLALHGGIAAIALALARPLPPSAEPPPVLAVQIVAAPGQPGGDAAARPTPTPSQATRPARTEPAPPRPARPRSPSPQRTQNIPTPSSAAALAAEIDTGGNHPAAEGGQQGPPGAGTGQPGAPHGPAGPGRGGGEEMEAYLDRLRRAIQQALVYPPAARRLNLAGEVRVRFQLLADGRIDLGSLAQTGGTDDEILRRGALDTIRRLAAVPPPPQGAMAVEVPVSFTLARP